MHIGIDEVGRGCWAGPLLVVAARSARKLPQGLKDSKKLSKNQREALIEAIEHSCDLGEGWVEPTEIDERGLASAMRLGVSRALSSLNASPDEAIIMDGNINYCSDMFTNIICVAKADDKFPVVSAASIYAKVRRDQAMREFATQYLDYGFEKHVGYGTKLHREALYRLGVTPIHRKSFKPVQGLL